MFQIPIHNIFTSQDILCELYPNFFCWHFRLGKRAAQLSINQDLHAIANGLKPGGGRGSSQTLLNRLGKRAPSLSVNADLMAIADSMRGKLHLFYIFIPTTTINDPEDILFQYNSDRIISHNS